MVSLTPRELFEKAMQSSEYDRKIVMLFGLTGEEILKRIEFYDSHSFIERLEANPELKIKRKAFREALANLGHSEATCYSHWALIAFDKAHKLR